MLAAQVRRLHTSGEELTTKENHYRCYTKATRST